MSTGIDLRFADGDYLFSLNLPQILELQRLCGAGIYAIYGRTLKGFYEIDDGQGGRLEFGVPQEGDAHILDLFETVRLALIGGGRGLVNGQEVKVDALRARQLVETYCHPAPLEETRKLAKAILFARIEGYTQKKSPEPEHSGESLPTASTKRKSSRTAQ